MPSRSTSSRITHSGSRGQSRVVQARATTVRCRRSSADSARTMFQPSRPGLVGDAGHVMGVARALEAVQAQRASAARAVGLASGSGPDTRASGATSKNRGTGGGSAEKWRRRAHVKSVCLWPPVKSGRYSDGANDVLSDAGSRFKVRESRFQKGRRASRDAFSAYHRGHGEGPRLDVAAHDSRPPAARLSGADRRVP